MDKKSGKSAQKNKKSLPDYLEEAREIEAELDSMEDPWADDPEVEERLRKKVYQRIMEEQQKIIKKQSLTHKIGKYTVDHLHRTLRGQHDQPGKPAEVHTKYYLYGRWGRSN